MRSGFFTFLLIHADFRGHVPIGAALCFALLTGAAAVSPVRADVAGVRFDSRPVGFLGVQVADVDAEAAMRLRLPEERGVRILKVKRKSPAKQSGLQADDVLWTFRGVALHSVAQLRRLVRETPPGRRIGVSYYRDGSRKSTSITVAAHDDRAELTLDLPDFHLALPQDLLRFGPFDAMRRPPRLGVSVVALTDQLAAHLGAKGGLLVTAVESTSAADEAGIRAGDVIQRIDGHALANIADLRDALREKERVSLELVHDRKTRTVTVPLAEARPAEPMI